MDYKKKSNLAIQLAVGRKIRKRRDSINKSQGDIAKASGVDRTYISRVERGKVNISIVNLCRIAKALEIKPHNLINFG